MSQEQNQNDQLLKDQVNQLLNQSTFQTTNRQLGWTNAVLMRQSQYKHHNQEVLDFYVPGYLRLKVKNFISISLPAMQSVLNCQINFSFYYGDLPQQLVDLFKDKIVMNLIRNSSFSLSPSFDCQVTQQKEVRLVNYVLKKQINMSYYPYIDSFPFTILDEYDGSLWFSPYQIISQVLTVQIPNILIQKSRLESTQKGKANWDANIKKLEEIGLKNLRNVSQIQIHVNLMDYQTHKFDKDNNLVYSERKDHSANVFIMNQPMLGKYGLATKKIQAHYSNQNYILHLSKQRKAKQIEYRKQHCLARLLFKDPQQIQQKKQNISKEPSNGESNNQYTQRHINLFAKNKSQAQKDKEQKAKLMVRRLHYEEQFQNRQISFVNAHFVIPIFRYPLMPLLTIFIPLWLISINNLGVYLSSTEFNYRLGTLVAIIFTNVALIPNYKAQLPPYPGFLLIQLFIYLQQISILLCLISSFFTRFDRQSTVQISQMGPLFFISLGLNSISLILLFFSYLIYKFSWEKTYIYSEREKQTLKVGKKHLNYLLWNNPKSDKYFLQNGQIIPLKQGLKLFHK